MSFSNMLEILQEKNKSKIVLIELELEDNQIIKLRGYDEMADFIYRNTSSTS